MYNFSYIDPPTLDDFRKLAEYQYFSAKKLSFRIVDNGIALPFKTLPNESRRFGGGIVSPDGEYIETTSLHLGLGKKYDYDESKVEHSPHRIVFIGLFATVWGHCLTDNIKRLWFLKSDEYKEHFSDYRPAFIPFSNFGFSNHFIELLSMLGIDYTLLMPITKITEFRSILIPDESFYSSGDLRLYTKEYVDTINEIKAKVAISGDSRNKRVYFTRTHLELNGKTEFGEKEIERLFRAHGYRVIAPEEISLKEQLGILMNCDHFAATEGSISHNSVFMKDGADVVILSRGAYHTEYQFTLNAVNNLSVTYIDSHLSIFTDRTRSWLGPFFYYRSEALMRYFGEPYDSSCFPVKLFRKYLMTLEKLPDLKNRFSIDDYYLELLDKVKASYFKVREERQSNCISYRIARSIYHFLKRMLNLRRILNR